MSERPHDSGLTSGDPLGPSTDAPPQEQHAPGYSTPAPPGALGGYAPQQSMPAGSGQYELAGWWSRVGAFLIDGLIVTIAALVIIAIFGSIFSVGFFDSEETGFIALAVGFVLATLAFTVAALLYAPVMMSKTNGKTLGRMALNIRVVRANGKPITFGFAMLREVAVKALLFGIAGSFTFGLANLADYLWPLWDDENRALHDFVVDTRTVKD